MMEIKEKDGAVILNIRLQPRSSRNQLIGFQADGRLKIKLVAPPVDNEANEELVKYLAKTLHIAKQNIEIIKGQTSRDKLLRITGVTEVEIIRLVE
ncbi:MAG: DUF167 domain-containing protein [Candidatus Margulisiibacteriota bacterium]|jgi:hypothetical protein